MTRKHFELLAKSIADIRDYQDRVKFCQSILPMCYQENPRFDAVRFVKAANCLSLLGD